MKKGKIIFMDYRIEQKFLCTQKEYAILKSRLPEIMNIDKNANADNQYLIRSVYFDDMYHSKYHENEQGCDNRFKYRIRTYDCNDNIIQLEKKSKLNTYTNKKSCPLSKEEYANFMKGDFLFHPSTFPLANEFALSILLNRMAPSAIIDYNREAYTYAAGNTRITFDSNIGVSGDYQHFFHNELATIPLLQTGYFILEVKYDEFLPKAIASMLELRSLQQITFSKFYVGKQKLLYHDGGFTNGFYQ